MSNTKKRIESLTPEQAAMLERYRDMARDVATATGPNMDVELVKELTNKHRLACGVPVAQEFHVADSPFEVIDKFDGTTESNALYGQHDAHWLYTYLFFRVELGLVEETEPLVHLIELTKHVNWFWMDETRTVVVRRPVACHLKTVNEGGLRVLHKEGGLAMEFADGRGVYALNGVRIPAGLSWVAADTVEALEARIPDVLRIDNVEIRTQALARMSAEAITCIPGTAVIDGAVIEPGGRYELLSVPLGIRIQDEDGDEREQPALYLRGNCPSSGKPFVEAVPFEIATVKQALAWREGDDGEWIRPARRT